MTKVLIVDDEPSLRFAVHEALEAHGIDVISVDRAADALPHLDDVDVVVSDYMMPDLDGMQLLERVQATHPSVPVVLVTAHGSERLAVVQQIVHAHGGDIAVRSLDDGTTFTVRLPR